MSKIKFGHKDGEGGTSTKSTIAYALLLTVCIDVACYSATANGIEFNYVLISMSILSSLRLLR